MGQTLRRNKHLFHDLFAAVVAGDSCHFVSQQALLYFVLIGHIALLKVLLTVVTRLPCMFQQRTYGAALC